VFNNDYFMREMEKISLFLANALSQKDIAIIDIIDEQGNILEENLLRYELSKMVQEHRINDAENYLFDKMEGNPTPEYLKIAIDFYSKLEKLSDSYLVECGFEREEILDGLKAINKIYKMNE